MLFSSFCRVARDGSSHRLLTISVFLCELVCVLLSTGRVLKCFLGTWSSSDPFYWNLRLEVLPIGQVEVFKFDRHSIK
jgi:hypothetical protein